MDKKKIKEIIANMEAVEFTNLFNQPKVLFNDVDGNILYTAKQEIEEEEDFKVIMTMIAKNKYLVSKVRKHVEG